MSIRDEIHDVVHAWLLEYTDLPAEQIVPKGENAPEPEGLFIQINPLGDVGAAGMQPDKEYIATGVYRHTSHKERRVSLTARGPGANDTLEALQYCWATSFTRRLFDEAGFVLVGLEQVRDLSTKSGGRELERANLDLQLRYARSITETVPIIREVEFDVEVGTDTISGEAVGD